MGEVGVAPLLHAAWRNDVSELRCLVESGAPLDVQDAESGWTALHRALYFGHFRCAAVLLEAGASLTNLDHQERTPLDLLSSDLECYLAAAGGPLQGQVFSWGNGSNYQLGTGAEGLQLSPVRLDSLHEASIVQVAAAKFHSAAVTQDGRLFTWGFGRGGRLGQEGFHIHSGESAVIVPRQVMVGLGRRRVTAVATAKYHTVALTDAGELFSWGSNRDGRLGYAAVDTQPTPRRVSLLKQRVLCIAAANKHSVAIVEGGTVFSWGANDQGQLGYGTSDSASNAVPRLVEAMKGKQLVAVAAAKRHTVVLTASGDVYTWGHRAVTPRRLQLAGARDVARSAAGAGTSAGWEVVFHKGQSEMNRPHATAIAAGAAHSCCLTRTGAVLAWCSWDPQLNVQEVQGRLAGVPVVALAAGKYRTAVATASGDVFMWEGLSKQHPTLRRRPDTADVPGERISSGLPAAQRPAQTTPANLEQQLAPVLPCSSSSGQLHEGGHRGSSHDGASAHKHRRGDKAKLLHMITPERVEGVKRVTKVAVGEKHSLALQSWCVAPVGLQLPSVAAAAGLGQPARPAVHSDDEDAAAVQQEDAEWTAAADRAVDGRPALAPPPAPEVAACWPAREYWMQLEQSYEQVLAAQQQIESELLCDALTFAPDGAGLRGSTSSRRAAVPSLQRLCERSVAQRLVELRTVLQLMEYADAVGAEVLKQYCMAVALSNLDAVLMEARGVADQMPHHLLHEMEQLQQGAAPLPAGYGLAEGRQGAMLSLPVPHARRRPTAAPADIGRPDSSEHGSMLAAQASGMIPASPLSTSSSSSLAERNMKHAQEAADAAAIQRQVRILRKKLQQIEHLEQRSSYQLPLDTQQRAKVTQKCALTAALAALEGGAPLSEAQRLLLGTGLASASNTVSLAHSSSGEKPALPTGGKLRQAGSNGSRPAEALPTPEAGGLAAERPVSGTVLGQAGQGSMAEAAAGPSGRQQGTALPGSLASPPLALAWAASHAQAAAGGGAAGGGIQPGISQSDGAGGAPVPTPATTASRSLLSAALAPKISSSNTSPGQQQGWPDLLAAAKSPAALATAAGTGSGKKAKPGLRRGGLSMFLSGEMEQPAREPSPQPAPQPAPEFRWAAASENSGALVKTSLRDIQQQEASAAAAAAASDKRASRTGFHGVPAPTGAGKPPTPAREGRAMQAAEARMSLGRFMGSAPKSAPIAVAGSASEAPAEPKAPAWGGGAQGGSPSAAEGAAQPAPVPAKLSLRDIQMEQEAVRESCSRSWGALGSSPGSGGNAGTHFAHWNVQSGAPAPPGSSPGALFPSGSSPGGTRKVWTPSPQSNKWYIKEERPVVPLEVIQSEEARELEAAQQARQEQQQQAAAAKAAASAEQEAEQQRDKRRRQQQARRQRKAAAAAATAAAAAGPDSDEAAKPGEAEDAMRRRQQRKPSGGPADESRDGAAQPAEGGHSDAMGGTSDDAGLQEGRSAAAAQGPNRGQGRPRPKDVAAPGVRNRLSGAGTPREQETAAAGERVAAARPRTAGRGSSGGNGDLAAPACSSQPAVPTNGQRPPAARPRTVGRGILRQEQAGAARATQSAATRSDEAPASARLDTAGRAKGQAAPKILTVARPKAARQPNKPAVVPAAASTSAMPATVGTHGPASHQNGVPDGQL